MPSFWRSQTGRSARSCVVGARQLARHHVTVFLDPRASGPVEELRSRWDPVMARQIAAHITLIYPEEVSGRAGLERRAAEAASRTPLFTITLGPAFFTGSPAAGVFFHVHDPGNGIGTFRAQAVPPARAVDFPPHVTIVHPRTSGLGRQAWPQLAATRVDARFTITRVAITVFSEDRWQIVRWLPLSEQP
jgi:2'-5' RNA ligase